jgi:hypothetical protein
MKIVPVLFAFVSFGLCLAAHAQGDGRPSAGGSKPRETSANISRPPPQRALPAPYFRKEDPPPIDFTEGVGVCLIGDEYMYKTDPADVNQCDAIIWVNAVNWVVNQRKLIDESLLVGEAEESEGSTTCRSCTGTCQTVALPIKDSTYEDVEADSGLNPGECLGNIKAICESGSFRQFATARCGN